MYLSAQYSRFVGRPIPDFVSLSKQALQAGFLSGST
jgi:hypothetical protein